jgi:hypothetical protein
MGERAGTVQLKASSTPSPAGSAKGTFGRRDGMGIISVLLIIALGIDHYECA